MACAFLTEWEPLEAEALLTEAAVTGRFALDFLTGDDADEVLGGSELPPVAL